MTDSEDTFQEACDLTGTGEDQAAHLKKDALEYAVTCCPNCSCPVPFWQRVTNADPHCPQCGFLLWCRKRTVNDVVVLDATPGRTPGVEDIESLCNSIVWPNHIPRVLVNLGDLEHVTSGFLAGLITLGRYLNNAGGALVLCSLCPLVRTVFHRTHVDTLFAISRDEEEGLIRLQPGVGCGMH
jgi:anti-anti-sigma regulatory factor